MKQVVLLLGLICIFYILVGNVVEEFDVRIPDEAIRIRIVANSNTEYDQRVKRTVRDSVQQQVASLLKDASSLKEAKELLSKNLPKIDQLVSSTLKDEKYALGYTIHLGYNYFPQKEYKGVLYEDGLYESLLITLGEGAGDNWWCVLFPPLCLLEAEESDEIEYKSYVKELINKYF